jgi:hypothetical protein
MTSLEMSPKFEMAAKPLVLWHAGGHPEDVFITVYVSDVASNTYVELFATYYQKTQQVSSVLEFHRCQKLQTPLIPSLLCHPTLGTCDQDVLSAQLLGQQYFAACMMKPSSNLLLSLVT